MQLVLRDFELSHVGGIQTVKSSGVFEHRRITARLHIGQDVGHALLDGGIGVGRPVQALGKSGLEIGVLRGQAQGLGAQHPSLSSLRLQRRR